MKLGISLHANSVQNQFLFFNFCSEHSKVLDHLINNYEHYLWTSNADSDQTAPEGAGQRLHHTLFMLPAENSNEIITLYVPSIDSSVAFIENNMYLDHTAP